MPDPIPVRVAHLEASIPEGILISWRGCEFRSGPLIASLRDGISAGVLDYERRTAELEFHIKLEFPEFAETLNELGVDAVYAAPIEATIRSTGPILDGHGLGLSGCCELQPHGLFANAAQPERERASAQILPGT